MIYMVPYKTRKITKLWVMAVHRPEEPTTISLRWVMPWTRQPRTESWKLLLYLLLVFYFLFIGIWHAALFFKQVKIC